MTKTIRIDYTPRPLWRDVIHPALDTHRYSVLVCHRRFGKTVGCVNELIRQALKNDKLMPQLAYIAPFRNQAKHIAWNYLKHYTRDIPGMKTNESELFVEFPTRHINSPGARIFIIGADHPDALRGMYWDMAVLDEYADIKPELWDEVLTPALVDRHGKAVFCGTPKGQNQFYDKYCEAIRKKDWFSCLYTAEDSHVIDDDELASMKENMTDIAYRQEMMCDFTVSAQNIVIPIALVDESMKRRLTEADVKGAPVIMGVDIARFGDDATTIWRREGLWVDRPLVYRGLSTMEAADKIVMAMRNWGADIMYIDSGNMGAGVIDRIRQLGYTNVSEVAFGSQAINSNRYANIRAEMYFKARDFMAAGGAVPEMPELKQELTVTEYFYTPASKIQLIPKEDIKLKLGRSPDLADGLALTFARPYMKPSRMSASNYKRDEEYNPFADM